MSDNGFVRAGHAPLRVALVGAGAMGSLHARVLMQHPQVELTSVVDVDAEAGAALADRYGATYGAELEPTACDAVIVATPTDTHLGWSDQAIAAGRPVLVEKPLASTLGDARRIVERAARADVPLMCGFIERWNGAVTLAQDIVKDPLHIQAMRHSPYAPRVRGGVASDLLIHDVDLALRFFNSTPIGVQAQLGYFHPYSVVEAEDVAEAQLSFGDGGLATLSASRIAQRKVRMMYVYTLDRMIEVDLLRQEVTVYRHVGNEFEDTGAYRQQTVIDIPVMAQRREPLYAQLEHFVALARGEYDHALERATLLPAHEVVDRVLAHRPK
jgi:predicted dehydrogenase